MDIIKIEQSVELYNGVYYSKYPQYIDTERGDKQYDRDFTQYRVKIMEDRANFLKAYNLLGELMFEQLNTPIDLRDVDCDHHNYSLWDDPLERYAFARKYFPIDSDEYSEYLGLVDKATICFYRYNTYNPESWVMYNNIKESLDPYIIADMPDNKIVEFLCTILANSGGKYSLEEYFNENPDRHPMSKLTIFKMRLIITSDIGKLHFNAERKYEY